MAKKKVEKPEPKSAKVHHGPFHKTETVPPTAVPTLYVNSVNIDLTSLDVRLRLGQIQGVSSEGALLVAEQAHVYMSHQHFRAVVAAVIETMGKLDSIAPPAPKALTDDKAH